MPGLFSHQIGSPPIASAGSAELKARVLPSVIAGEKISALAITEPGGGSDVANLATTARLDAGDYVVNGEKTFITSGMRADFYTVAVRTGGGGASGVSLLLIEREREGFTRTPLKKMGWWCSDTATLHFDNVRVPAGNLIGEENAGFRIIMRNFNAERLGMAAGAVGFAQACLDEAVAWARERKTFGKHLIEHQVVRHKLVEMQTRIHAARALVYDTCWKLENAPRDKTFIAQLAMTKNLAGAGHAVLLRRSGADPGRRGLHPRHALGARLPRGEGVHDRRRLGRDHEGPRGAATRMVTMDGRNDRRSQTAARVRERRAVQQGRRA